MAGQHNKSSLARKVGITRSYLVMIAGGQRTCSPDTADAIAAALHVRTDLLFTPAMADDSAATTPKGE
ncbi:helix-turn-helix transcriptional regulator [Microtetraspora glauca]|uniref:Helix-turn-helix transcriptional regulator n=1 Tax=Microtetraspora glauca TaxID=1996 RepID=A0ABV3GA14_MICGL